MEKRASFIQLAERVAENSGCSRAEAKRRIEVVLESIVELADEYPRVTLREFGTFKIKLRNGFVHSATLGGKVVVKPRKVLTFTSSPMLTQEVDA
jgi:nucleoid DNA-binding protein